MRTLLAASLCLLFFQAQAVEIDRSASTLGFEVDVGDTRITGIFSEWSATIQMDGDVPTDIEAQVQVRSVQLENALFNSTMHSDEWLSSERFPVARFVSLDIQGDGEGRYVASGELTLRGKTRPLVITVSELRRSDPLMYSLSARMDRTTFNIGTSGPPVSDFIEITGQIAVLSQ